MEAVRALSASQECGMEHTSPCVRGKKDGHSIRRELLRFREMQNLELWQARLHLLQVLQLNGQLTEAELTHT